MALTVAATNGALAADPGLFATDFETGTLLKSQTPPGAFTRVVVTDAASDAGVQALAAHRGSWGLRVADPDVPATSDKPVLELQYTFAGSLFGDLYLRSWLRVATDAANSDTVRLLTVQGNTAVGPTMATAGLKFDGGVGSALVNGKDQSGSETAVFTATALDTDWHLWELAALGVGSDAGVRQVFIDGARVAEQAAIDWTGVVITRLSVGETFADDQTFTGILDFDDVRSSSFPQMSTLVVTAAPALRGCLPVRVSAVDSLLDVAPAPYDLTAEMTVHGVDGGGYFSDPACVTPASTVSLASGESTAQVYFLSEGEGTAALAASHRDFLSVPLVLFIVHTDAGTLVSTIDGGVLEGPDAGAWAPSTYRVGCGCAQPPTALMLDLALVCLLGSRRPRRRFPPGS
jgi:hypothetical protein